VGIAWEWQSVDGAMVKAPLAIEDVGPNPTDRAKNGSERHLLVNERGIPLSLVVTSANRHDVSQLEAVLDAIVIVRPEKTEQHLCADKGYHGDPARRAIEARNYVSKNDLLFCRDSTARPISSFRICNTIGCNCCVCSDDSVGWSALLFFSTRFC